MTDVHCAHRIVSMILACPVGDPVSTNDIHAHLEKVGYPVCRRTVERDMLAAVGKFGIDKIAKRGCPTLWIRERSLEPT